MLNIHFSFVLLFGNSSIYFLNIEFFRKSLAILNPSIKIIENENDHVINEDKENDKPEDSQQQILVEEEKTSNNQDDVSIQVSTFLS